MGGSPDGAKLMRRTLPARNNLGKRWPPPVRQLQYKGIHIAAEVGPGFVTRLSPVDDAGRF